MCSGRVLSATNVPTDLRLAWAERVRALEGRFRAIDRGPMADLPMRHPGLQVQVVGITPLADAPDVAVGILITPWCMNLLRLPLRPAPAKDGLWLEVGRKGVRQIGPQSFEFIGAHEPGFDAYEVCSLFSPMNEFIDQAAAVATAYEVLKLLRSDATLEPLAAPPRAAASWIAEPRRAAPAPSAAPALSPASRPGHAAPTDNAVAARRGFLLGRRAAPGGAE